MSQHQTVAYSGRGLRPTEFDRRLALGGVIGPILFVLTFTVAGYFRPGYSEIAQAISDLGVGDNAWILNGSLVILGLLLVCFAVSFFRSVQREAKSALRLACAVLLGMVGVGYAVAGIFPQTSPIHWMVGAALIFLCAPLAFFFSGLLLRANRVWRGFGTYSLIASVTTIVLTVITFYTFAPNTPPTLRIGGLMERILFIEILTWYVSVGWRLWRSLPPTNH